MAYKPTAPNEFQEEQIILNSNRILFNAKTDSVLLFAQKSIGLSTNGSLNFDTGTTEESKMVVNTPFIYLGMVDGALPHEPAILGNKLAGGNPQEDGWLELLLNHLVSTHNFLKTQFKVTDSSGNQTSPGSNDFSKLQGEIDKLRGQLENIKSKRIKIT